MSRRRVFVFALAVMTAAAGQTTESSRPPQGRPLVPASQHNGVARGERVIVEVTSGAARLAFETTAESAGGVGNFVLVRNPANGRLFPAKVAAKGKVVVQR
jgi:flagella basal body P-ring formation protein FlgA